MIVFNTSMKIILLIFGLNILDKYVDYFVISESTKNHQGKDKKINFKIENFPKFKNKIRFLESRI